MKYFNDKLPESHFRLFLNYDHIQYKTFQLHIIYIHVSKSNC